MVRPPSRGRRGQLYLDFVVGISVFLLAMAFVLSFAPGMFGAFDADPSRPLVADRTTARLSGPMLGVEDSPSRLNTTCVEEFFTRSGGNCGFDHGAAVTAQVGVDPHTRLNVSLTRPVSDTNGRKALCIDSGTVLPCPGGTTLTVGPSLPTHDTDTTAPFRTVHVDGRDATLDVRVW
jgi:hypothetical protein